MGIGFAHFPGAARGAVRRQFILHIGRQKTGTTSIQRFLANNPEALAAEGIYYPKTGRVQGAAPAHHELAIALNERESSSVSARELYALFEKELAGRSEPVIILSSEAFQRLSDLTPLRQFLQGHAPTVVCYLREPFAAKQSAWAQSVHATRQNATFEHFALHSRLRYAKFVKRWRAFSEQLIVGLFEKQRLYAGDAVADFLLRIGFRDFAGLSGSLQREDGLPSIGGNLLYLKRIINLVNANMPNTAAEFDALSQLAGEEPRWRGRWYVEPKIFDMLRKVDIADSRFLNSLFDDVQSVPACDAPKLPDWSRLRDDTARVLAHPELCHAFAPLGLTGDGRQPD